jgi:hypothetical protein
VSILLIEHYAQPLFEIQRDRLLNLLKEKVADTTTYEKLFLGESSYNKKSAPTLTPTSSTSSLGISGNSVAAQNSQEEEGDDDQVVNKEEVASSDTAFADNGSISSADDSAVARDNAAELLLHGQPLISYTLDAAETVKVPIYQYATDGSLAATKRNSILLGTMELPKQPKKVVFCVPTIPLVHQQSDKIRRNTDLSVGEYSREDHASLLHWDPLGWYYEVSRKHVLVFTPQILLNLLRHGYMKMSRDVSVLIFDECHHAWKNHPYIHIMKEFYHTIPEKDQRPKIFGMTASPVFQRAATREASLQLLNKLKQNLACSVVTITDRSVLKGFVASAKETLIEYSPTVVPAEEDLMDLAGLDLSTTTELPQLFQYYHRRLIELEAMGKLQNSSTIDSQVSAKITKHLQMARFLRTSLGVWSAARYNCRNYHQLMGTTEEVKRKDILVDAEEWSKLKGIFTYIC